MSMETLIAKLEEKHAAMAEDMAEIKTAIKSIAETLRKIETIEERQVSQAEAIRRAHDRVDLVEVVFKDEIRSHEKRIQQLEIHNAKTVWIERFVSAIVLGVIGMWIKGGL